MLEIYRYSSWVPASATIRMLNFVEYPGAKVWTVKRTHMTVFSSAWAQNESRTSTTYECWRGIRSSDEFLGKTVKKIPVQEIARTFFTDDQTSALYPGYKSISTERPDRVKISSLVSSSENRKMFFFKRLWLLYKNLDCGTRRNKWTEVVWKHFEVNFKIIFSDCFMFILKLCPVYI